MLALEDKAQRYLEESIGHLRKVVTDLRDQRADEDLDLELWRAYSKAEFALFVLSISEKRNGGLSRRKSAEASPRFFCWRRRSSCREMPVEVQLQAPKIVSPGFGRRKRA